jgi:hypothetical protein
LFLYSKLPCHAALGIHPFCCIFRATTCAISWVTSLFSARIVMRKSRKCPSCSMVPFSTFVLFPLFWCWSGVCDSSVQRYKFVVVGGWCL